MRRPGCARIGGAWRTKYEELPASKRPGSNTNLVRIRANDGITRIVHDYEEGNPVDVDEVGGLDKNDPGPAWRDYQFQRGAFGYAVLCHNGPRGRL